MSPFFRGSVRPTKRQPRAWSLNPRLNPDLGKENNSGRVSILGLPATETEVTLPVFNTVYTKPSPAVTEKRAVAKVNGGSHPGFPEAIAEESEADEPQVTETHVAAQEAAETADVTGPGGGDVATIANTDTTETQPVVTSTATESTQPEPAAQRPVEESLEETAPQEQPATHAPAPAVSENWPLPVESPIINHFVDAGNSGRNSTGNTRAGATAAADEATRAVGTVEARPAQTDAADVRETTGPTGTTEQQPDVAEATSPDPVAEPAASQESAEAEVRREVPAESVPAEHLPVIDEEAPGDEGSEEPVVSSAEHAEAEDLGPSGLTSIEEETEAGEDSVVAATTEAEADATEDLNAGSREPDAAEAAPPAEETPEVGHEPHEQQAGGGVPADDEEPAAEAPVVPRHSPKESPTTAEHTAPAASAAARDSLTGSISTNEEPLVTDEQLEVSEEFKPEVRMYSMESSR